MCVRACVCVCVCVFLLFLLFSYVCELFCLNLSLRVKGSGFVVPFLSLCPHENNVGNVGNGTLSSTPMLPVPSPIAMLSQTSGFLTGM